MPGWLVNPSLWASNDDTHISIEKTESVRKPKSLNYGGRGKRLGSPQSLVKLDRCIIHKQHMAAGGSG